MDEVSKSSAPVRSRSVKLATPEGVFNGWAYRVGRHHFAAFGVAMREFQDAGKKVLRWSIMEPRMYAFEVGDMYYLASSSDRVHLQVAAVWPDGRLEVHQGEWFVPSRSARLVTPAGFAQWLELGTPPAEAELVLKGASKAGALAYQLPQ